MIEAAERERHEGLARLEALVARGVALLQAIHDRLPAPAPAEPVPVRSAAPPWLTWLTTDQMVEATGRSVSTLWRRRAKSEELKELAPSVRPGQPMRWHIDAVELIRGMEDDDE